MGKSVALLLVLIFSVASCVIAAKPVSEATPVENSWTTKAPMPTTRDWLGVAAVNGKIYAIGGASPSGAPVSTNEAYNPATDTWVSKKSLPSTLAEFGIAVYQNEIYVIGGYWGLMTFGSINAVCAYNPATNTWETKASMPTPRGEVQASVVDGKIYVIGGSTTGADNITNVNEVYDPVTDTWATKAPIPTPVSAYASAVVDNKIYVMGGLTRTANSTAPSVTDLNQIYDPETDTWSLGAPLPTSAAGAAAGATTGVFAPKLIYVIGGQPNQVYNPENNSWTTGASMPTARYGLGVAVVNDLLYAIGGIYTTSFSSFYAVNEQYTPFGFWGSPPETTPPTISIVSPENKTYTVNNVSLTYTVSEAASWVGYSLDGQANVTIAGNTTLTGLSDGSHNLTVYANDTAGNTGASETIHFSIKTQQSEPFPITWVAATAAAVVGLGCLLYFAKFRKKAGKE